MATSPIWILDTSSLIVVRTQTPRASRAGMYAAMTALVQEGRLKFPRELVAELKRYAGAENPALVWATENADKATEDQPPLTLVRRILADVREVLDPDKEGEDEADPYVLAMARHCRHLGDVRVVTEEFNNTGEKMSLASAAGYIGVPAVALRAFLKFEEIAPWM